MRSITDGNVLDAEKNIKNLDDLGGGRGGRHWDLSHRCGKDSGVFWNIFRLFRTEKIFSLYTKKIARVEGGGKSSLGSKSK